MCRQRGAAFAAFLLAAAPAWAQAPAISDDVVRIGVLNDMSGRFADLGGPGSLEAARMAVEDFGGKVLGKPIEVISADHQNKADVGANIARDWVGPRRVDMITDLMNSAVALAALNVVRQADKVAIVNGAGTTRITNESCTPNSVHYAWDTYALSNAVASAVVKAGGDSWYFITADYAGGHSQEKEATDALLAAGGKVAGRLTHPQDALDMSSFLLQAQASGAKVIALANGGGDTINSIKAANDFQITRSGQTVVPLAFFIPDIHALGLEVAQGITLVEGFYWDLDEQTRAFARRFQERRKAVPTHVQAGVYSSTLHYLKAVEAAGTDQGVKVVEQMKAMPVNDLFAKNGRVLSNGRFVHDMYLMQVKTPGESKGAWDYFHVREVIPGALAFQAVERSTCKMDARR